MKLKRKMLHDFSESVTDNGQIMIQSSKKMTEIVEGLKEQIFR